MAKSKRTLVDGKYMNKQGVTPGGRKYHAVINMETGKKTTRVSTPGDLVRYQKADGVKEKFTGTKNSPDRYGGYKRGKSVSQELKKPAKRKVK